MKMAGEFGNVVESLSYDQLFAGNVSPIVADTATITGGSYVRGTVLGLVTASGKLTIVDSTKSDGTQAPYAVLAGDVDASSGDKSGTVYYTGEFNTSKLVFGGTDTAATHKAAARKVGMYFKSVISA